MQIVAVYFLEYSKSKRNCVPIQKTVCSVPPKLFESFSLFEFWIICLIMASSFIYFNENLLSVLLEPDWEVCVQLRPQLAHQAGVGQGRASGQQPLV